jgi:phenylacetic acid degradation operon negative regulatory protein
MSRLTIRKWIDRSLTIDPPRAKSLVVTIFGDAIQPYGGSIRLKELIDLLAPFGINDRLVRTCVFRLVREQWLQPNRHGRESSYQLTESGGKRFALAYDKIYRRQAKPWDGCWTLVALPADRVAQRLRLQLREELGWLGFRQLLPSLFAHPQMDRAAVAEMLDRLEAGSNVIVCQAIELTGFGKLAHLVENAWDLAAVIQGYRTFLRRFGALQRLAVESVAPRDWFMIRTLLIHTFRRIVLHDPLLPAELLPGPWIGSKAYALAGTIYRSALAASERHLNQTVASISDRPKLALCLLRERFREEPNSRLNG